MNDRDEPPRPAEPLLSYRSPRQRYIPPYYPERGEGIALSVIKLVVAAILIAPGSAMAAVVVMLLVRDVRAAAAQRFAAVAVAAALSAAFLAPGMVLGSRAIVPLWCRWKSYRLRRER